MSKKSKKQLTDWAQFRFSIIGGLLVRPPLAGELRNEIEKLASRCYVHPTKDGWVTLVSLGSRMRVRMKLEPYGRDDQDMQYKNKVRDKDAFYNIFFIFLFSVLIHFSLFN